MAIAVQSSISGAMSSQPVTDTGTVNPFSSVVISDLNFHPTDTVKITSSAPSNGVLSTANGIGSYDSQTGVYTYTGNPADVTAAIQALVFTPTLHQVSSGSTVTTTFEIEDSNTAQIVIVADTSTSVITTAV
jgi:plastocyanin